MGNSITTITTGGLIGLTASIFSEFEKAANGINTIATSTTNINTIIASFSSSEVGNGTYPSQLTRRVMLFPNNEMLVVLNLFYNVQDLGQNKVIKGILMTLIYQGNRVISLVPSSRVYLEQGVTEGNDVTNSIVTVLEKTLTSPSQEEVTTEEVVICGGTVLYGVNGFIEYLCKTLNTNFIIIPGFLLTDNWTGPIPGTQVGNCTQVNLMALKKYYIGVGVCFDECDTSKLLTSGNMWFSCINGELSVVYIPGISTTEMQNIQNCTFETVTVNDPGYDDYTLCKSLTQNIQVGDYFCVRTNYCDKTCKCKSVCTCKNKRGRPNRVCCCKNNGNGKNKKTTNHKKCCGNK